MSGPEQPFDINNAIDGLNRTQLEGFIANAKDYLAKTEPATPLAPVAKREAAPQKGFVEEIDGLLASAEGPVKKITVTPPRLASYLQTLPLPQDARLQNLNIEILDGRSVRAQGKISKAGTSGFIVMLGADQDGGDLKVVSTGLTNVALTHRGQTGNITQHLGNLILTLQKQLDSQIADKTWKAVGFSISEDRARLVINFENGEQKQAREKFQESLINFRDLISNNELVRPKLTDLAAIILERTKNQRVSAEDYAGVLRERYIAGRIEKGRIYPGEMVKELFELLHEGEAEAIKAIIGQKLDAAGDTPWASSWRSYLAAPATPATPVGSTGQDSLNELLEGVEQAGQDYGKRKRQLAREGIRLLIEWDLQDITFSALTMADNIFRGKFLPDEEIWHKVKLLTPWEKKEELISSIAAKVSELAGRREFPSQEEQAWQEAWEKELAPAIDGSSSY